MALVQRSVFDTPGFARHVTVQDRLVLVSDGPGGLVLVDSSVATNPVQVGALPVSYPQEVRCSAIVSNQVVVPLWGCEAWAWATEVGLYDISDPAHITKTGAWITNGLARAVAVREGLVYVGVLKLYPTYIGSLPGSVVEVFDASNPANPIPSCTLEGFSFAREVKTCGDLLLVADLQSGAALVLLDGLPEGPPRHCPLPGWPEGDKVVYSLAMYSNTVYAACGENGLWVLDFSDPDHPDYVDSLWLPGSACSVAVVSNLVAVALGPGGVALLDVTEPLLPAWAGWLSTTGSAEYVTANEDLLYVADGSGGLVIAQLVDDDTDQDGLSDAWERAHFDSLDWDGSDNPDQDAFTNDEEQQLGTDPDDPASLFLIDRSGLWDGLFPVIYWTSVGGRRYDVEYSTNLLAPGGGFLSLGQVVENAAYGAQTNRSVIHELPLPTDGSRYYRIRLAP